MKFIITFVLGALTGACVLWFGFSKDTLILDKHLVVVDRFTGKASRVHVSIQESEMASEKEYAQMEELRKNPAPATEAAQPEWRELNESELKQLDFEWSISGGGEFHIKYHNPFEKDVRIEKVRVHIPPKNGHAAIDREYEVREDSICRPLADLSERLASLKMSEYEFYGPAVEGAPVQSTSRHIVGSITPSRASIRK